MANCDTFPALLKLLDFLRHGESMYSRMSPLLLYR